MLEFTEQQIDSLTTHLLVRYPGVRQGLEALVRSNPKVPISPYYTLIQFEGYTCDLEVYWGVEDHIIPYVKRIKITPLRKVIKNYTHEEFETL